MVVDEPFSYAIIITLDQPGDEAAETRIVLESTAQLQLQDGQTKRLADCTLADLQTYADELEAEIWRPYLGDGLVQLNARKQIKVAFHVVKSPAPSLQEMLEQIIVLPVAEELDNPPESIEVIDTAPEALVEDDEETPEVDDAVLDEATPDNEAEIVPPAADVVEDADVEDEEDSEIEEQEEEEGEQKESLRIAGLHRPVGHPSPSAVDILLNEDTMQAMKKHARSSLDKEVAGMLIGPMPEQKEDGRWIVHVTDSIIAKHTEMRGASVTYTPESWRYIHDVLAERYPNEGAVIVGWYHTHPGFGIFLSGMDMFIHTNFFNQPWHIAYVLDPRARTSGFFSWTRDHKSVQPYEFPWPYWAAGSW